ncbi:MAG: hypothetical protein N2738_02350 [Thermodesulfovibrionales bacterium]|nr:hypothetical protein [Thermodesulfovibrionales bacterium]
MTEALIVHKIPSRIRIKVPSKKGDISFFENVMGKLEEISAIEKIEINAYTGSIVIYSSSKSDFIVNSIKSMGLFNLIGSNYEKRTIHRSVKTAFKDIDKKVKGLTAGELNLADIVFLALIGVVVYQIQRGNFAAPAWYTAIWYAMNIFLKSEDKK